MAPLTALPQNPFDATARRGEKVTLVLAERQTGVGSARPGGAGLRPARHPALSRLDARPRARSLARGAPGSEYQPHGAGSLEHLLSVATQTPVLPELMRVGTLVEVVQAERPASPDLETWNTVEEPQGP